MEPFEKYPNGGKSLIGFAKGSNSQKDRNYTTTLAPPPFVPTQPHPPVIADTGNQRVRSERQTPSLSLTA